MNPLAKFEDSARAVWRSDLDQAEKAKRLKDVRAAILHYLARLEGTAARDPWDVRTLDRMRNYLKGLAADTEALALECERPASAKAASVASNPYVA